MCGGSWGGGEVGCAGWGVQLIKMSSDVVEGLRQ